MREAKYEAIRKLRKLEETLLNECMRNNLNWIGSFTIMFDNEEGRNIRYVKDMSLESTGFMKEFYDKRSASCDPEYGNIDWPYTGFVQGDIGGWMPITISRLVEWLEGSGYSVERFIETFRSKKIEDQRRPMRAIHHAK